MSCQRPGARARACASARAGYSPVSPAIQHPGLRTVNWQTGGIGLEHEIMATLGCSVAEKLLRSYLQAIHELNRVGQAYVHAAENGLPAQARSQAKLAADSTDRLQAAREAYQRHIRKHRC